MQKNPLHFKISNNMHVPKTSLNSLELLQFQKTTSQLQSNHHQQLHFQMTSPQVQIEDHQFNLQFHRVSQ